MIYQNYHKLDLTTGNQEMVPMEKTGMRFQCFRNTQNSFSGGIVPWHWHTAMEVAYVEKGLLEIQTIDQRTEMKQGEAIFINSGVLHSYFMREDDACTYYSLLFDASFLCGSYGNILDQKYVHPIQQSTDLQIYSIGAGRLESILLLAQVAQMIKLCHEEPFGYEFSIRAELGNFWLLLFQETAEIRKQSSPRSLTDMERMKQMLSFIQSHFAERISLTDIAASAGISERECVRCFRRCIDASPVNYLNDYRIEMAAGMLLSTSDSITNISENCGFSSASYFGKIFHAKMGFTPIDYRKGKLS